MNMFSYLGVASKIIDLLEDDIPFLEVMGRFQDQIYKYIKCYHRSNWKASQFEQYF
jgi:hypothetical protein